MCVYIYIYRERDIYIYIYYVLSNAGFEEERKETALDKWLPLMTEAPVGPGSGFERSARPILMGLAIYVLLL